MLCSYRPKICDHACHGLFFSSSSRRPRKLQSGEALSTTSLKPHRDLLPLRTPRLPVGKAVDGYGGEAWGAYAFRLPAMDAAAERSHIERFHVRRHEERD